MDRVNRITQAYSQTPWRKQTQWIGLFLLLLVLTATVAGLYLNLTARAAAIGRDIQGLQWDIEEHAQTNANLQSRLGYLTSSIEMEKRAKDLGFRPIGQDEQVFIPAPGYPGRSGFVLAPAPRRLTPSSVILPPEFTESIFEWLNRQMLTLPVPAFLEEQS